MTNSQRLATVRARLVRWLAEQQSGAAAPMDRHSPILSESILIRGEFYCGRRFRTATHEAVWFIEEDQLKIYRHDGQLACVLSGDQLSAPGQLEAAKFAQDEGPPVESRALIKLPVANPLPAARPDERPRRAA